MDAIQHLIDGKIDFQGQRLADRIMQESLVLGAVVAFVVGWWAQNLQLCMLIYGFTFFLALVLTVPPWPFYNRHHVEWLPASGDSPTNATETKSTQDTKATTSSSSTKRSKKNSQSAT